MVKSKQPKYRQKGKLTLFGRYFQVVCRKLHVSWEQIARESHLHPTTFSKMTTEGGNLPKRMTLDRAVEAMRLHKGWRDTYKTGIYNLAGHATPEQQEQAVHDLFFLEQAMATDLLDGEDEELGEKESE